jgi:hypothetical protein
MTEQALRLHWAGNDLTVRVEAETPQDAAELLDPFLKHDVMQAGPSIDPVTLARAYLQGKIAEAQCLQQAAARQVEAQITAAKDFEESLDGTEQNPIT